MAYLHPDLYPTFELTLIGGRTKTIKAADILIALQTHCQSQIPDTVLSIKRL